MQHDKEFGLELDWTLDTLEGAIILESFDALQGPYTNIPPN